MSLAPQNLILSIAKHKITIHDYDLSAKKNFCISLFSFHSSIVPRKYPRGLAHGAGVEWSLGGSGEEVGR